MRQPAVLHFLFQFLSCFDEVHRNEAKTLLLFLCIIFAIVTLLLYVKQSTREAALNTQLLASYSEVISSLESIHQSKQLTVSDVQMLKASVDQFCGQLELYVDCSPYVSKQINFVVATVYHGFLRLSAGLYDDINSIQESPSVLVTLKEKLDGIYTEISNMDNIESAAKRIRNNWN